MRRLAGGATKKAPEPAWNGVDIRETIAPTSAVPLSILWCPRTVLYREVSTSRVVAYIVEVQNEVPIDRN